MEHDRDRHRRDPGKRFAFDVKAVGFLPISRWEFDIEESDDGSLVTQRWTDLRPGFFKPIGGKVTGVHDRPVFNREAMTETLDALARSAESTG